MSEAIRVADFLRNPAVEDWRVTNEGAIAFYATDSLAQSVEFVSAIAEALGEREHRPSIDIRASGVTVHTITFREDHGGLTQDDLDICLTVNAVASEHGLSADPTRVQGLHIVPGAPDIKAVTPFWKAVLGYEPRPDSPEEDLVDPNDRNAPFWFETMEQPRADGMGAIHLAVWVPYDQAQARIDAALDAGGRLVRDEFAPSWWTLADAYGNEVDIATVTGRD